MRDAFRLEPWQVPGHLEERDGRLYLDGVDTVALAGEWGTPLFVYSERRLRESARDIVTAFRRHHPGATVAFASKACSYIPVLRLLREAGVACEVNSAGELHRARRAGFADADIVLNGVAKSKAELAAAMTPPIKAINADSVFELQRIAEVAGETGRTANVALRLVPEIESGTAPGIETASSATKFGMSLADLPAALDVLRANRGGINVVGLHVHVGSQITDRAAYTQAASFVAEQARALEAGLGVTLAHVNVGGGFPVDYVKYHDQSPAIGYYRSEVTPDDIAAAAMPTLAERLGTETEVIVEPGRRMVADAGIMLARVENVKTRGDDRWLYLDAGYHTLLEAFSYRWYFHAVPATRAAERETSRFRVVGPLCDNGDSFYDVEGEATVRRLIAAEPALAVHRGLLERHLVHQPGWRELPAGTGPGDLVAFLDVGAYSMDQVFGMNGRGRPAVVMVGEDGAVSAVRRADTEDDLWLNESA